MLALKKYKTKICARNLIIPFRDSPYNDIVIFTTINPNIIFKILVSIDDKYDNLSINIFCLRVYVFANLCHIVIFLFLSIEL